MMDSVGFTASVITILTLFLIIVKLPSTLSDSKAEHDRLKEDLRTFKDLLDEVRQQVWSLSDARLNRIKLRYQDLHAGSTKAQGRRFFSRLKSIFVSDETKRMKEDLKLLKDDLHTIVGLRGLTQSIESRHLIEAVHRSSLVEDRAIQFDSQNRVDIPRSPYLPYQATLLGPMFSMHGAMSGLTRSIDEPEIDLTDDLPNRDMRNCQPVSILEASSNFFPETYTNQSHIPGLVVTAFRELSQTKTSSVNSYRFIYRQRSRKVKFLSVALEIPFTSTYWKFSRATNHRGPCSTVSLQTCMPVALLKDFLLVLDSLDLVQNNAHISMRAPNGTKSNLTVTRITVRDAAFGHNSLGKAEQTVTDRLYHLGCRRFYEEEVVRLACLALPDRFLSIIEGLIVVEVISMHQPPKANFCYNILLLHLLRTEPGFARLKGVVLDSTTDRVKSYLVEWPNTACELLLHRASNPSKLPSWQLIVDWSKQLLQRLQAVHGAGGVVGMLRYPFPPILVDAFNQVHLWIFETRVKISYSAFPFFPPEFRYLAEHPSHGAIQSDDPLVTPAFDVYQCGQILWILATSWATPNKNAMALKDEFYAWPESWGKDLWFGPQPLARLPGTVPDWYQKIVDACVSDVTTRPSCGDLLAMFPTPTTEVLDDTRQIAEAKQQNQVDMRNCQHGTSGCDLCQARIVDQTYVCNVCYGGDFCICTACFNEGKHCNDRSHLLVERQSAPCVTRYYTSTDRTGKRQKYAM